ncbi:MAG: hypothetical protein EA358_05235 [Flavobacteriales bacterium]|nr:MAG: hypothetical protein EA358_05235 [Flavobacteriales bacterium]
MSTNALVFLANEQYAPYVKQMVYSARSHGCWSEDIVLLAWDLADASWFERRGVFVIPVGADDFQFGDLPSSSAVYFAKIILFHPKFSRWDKLIYLDVDMIIRKDIRHLLTYENFAAADDCFRYPVIHQMAPRNSDWSQAAINGIMTSRELWAVSFNSGMMVIPKKMLSQELFADLCRQTAAYWRECAYYDQGVLNMVLNSQRDRVPYVYNDYYFSEHFNRRGLLRRLSDRHAVILHIIHPTKPWDPRNPYHAEWSARMNKSEATETYQVDGVEPSRWGMMLVDFINRWNIAGVYFWGWWLDRYRGARWFFLRFSKASSRGK